MKRMLMLAAAIACSAFFVAGASAAIDWAGNAYPNNGFVTTPTGDQFVVAQVYKGGVTDGAGQGADISAVLRYQTDVMGSTVDVAMTYNTDVGNNDEYIGFIPQADLAGASSVSVTVIFTDLNDGLEFEITGDQNGNPAPLTYTVSNVLPNDVTVTFTLCMSGTATAGAPCVIGSAPEIGSWGTGVPMTNVGGELWTVDVTFAAGSNPSFAYKYKADDCNTWEGVPDRTVTLPTDGTASVAFATDSFNNAPIGCGLGNVLTEDKIVCFQVCMAGIDNTGGVCVIGSASQLTSWTTGVAMTHLGGDLWQACVTFGAGSPTPGDVFFKFKKDDCNTWESVGDRLVVIDDSAPATQDLTYSWDDAGGVCQPVAVEQPSFGHLKARFNN